MSDLHRVVEIAGEMLVGTERFNQAFAEKLGFPGWYSRNMSAWVDCMSCVDDPDSGMTRVTVPSKVTLTIQVSSYETFKRNAPAQWQDLIECSALVNFRRIETGSPAVLAHSFH